ncbi:hypothetical protein ACFX19_033132 [Malus domestica]
MDQRFHGLPHFKRFILMQQKYALLTPSCLPAKKRKTPRNQLVLLDPTASTAASSIYSLPYKKRVCAFQPDLFTEEPFLTLDLNVEYKSPFGWKLEEEAVEKLEEEKGKAENGCNEYIENTQKEKSQEISTYGDLLDLIVFCDGCNLMVHASCYGNPLVKGIPEGREGFDCSKVTKMRWKEKCYVCESLKGCDIQCSELKCPLAFHVSCGLNKDLCIEYKE